MICPYCKSDNIEISNSIRLKEERPPIIIDLILLLFTFGLWLIWRVLRNRKTSTIYETIATCKSCGKVWIVNKVIENDYQKINHKRLVPIILILVFVFFIVTLYGQEIINLIYR
ncbi:MAG: hypothetical protein RSA27_00145 [Oscillospiraceae bacterium]